jgi:hypothetical protein
VWSNGGFFRSSFWRVFSLVVALSIFMTLPLAAQQSAVSPPTNGSSTLELIQASQLLQTADPLLSKVIVLLLDRDNEIKSLRASLQSLSEQTLSDSALRQRQYEDLLSKLTASEMERAKLSTLFVALRGSYDAQLLNYQALQTQAQSVIADYEDTLKGERAQKLGWQIGGGIAVAVLGGLAGYEVGHQVFHWW